MFPGDYDLNVECFVQVVGSAAKRAKRVRGKSPLYQAACMTRLRIQWKAYARGNPLRRYTSCCSPPIIVLSLSTYGRVGFRREFLIFYYARPNVPVSTELPLAACTGGSVTRPILAGPHGVAADEGVARSLSRYDHGRQGGRAAGLSFVLFHGDERTARTFSRDPLVRCVCVCLAVMAESRCYLETLRQCYCMEHARWLKLQARLTGRPQSAHIAWVFPLCYPAKLVFGLSYP